MTINEIACYPRYLVNIWDSLDATEEIKAAAEIKRELD